MTAITLNFLGKILCCPPIINSPKGKPQATRTVIAAITPNNTAPNIENINQYSPFARYKKFIIDFISQSTKVFPFPKQSSHPNQTSEKAIYQSKYPF